MGKLEHILCTICMRGGSKGVAGKNLRKLHDKPLMAYTIEQAFGSGLFEHVVVSTDSIEIAETAKKYGAECWFLRPSSLATDEAPKLPVIRHALKESEKYYDREFEFLVDLDATSPLRTVDDIKGAYEQLVKENADIVITASPCRKNPYFNMVEIIDGRIEKVKKMKTSLTRRQDAPAVYDMNASIYIWKRSVLLNLNTLFTHKTSLYIMPEERSVDIDTELDWEFVEFIIGKQLVTHD
tara:strand:+ start:199 stop:915 length:717 start_codon:yes stop_codon:yes gene_type:complete